MAEPEKKSSIIDSFDLEIYSKSIISGTGFGVSNIFLSSNSLSLVVAVLVLYSGLYNNYLGFLVGILPSEGLCFLYIFFPFFPSVTIRL